MVPLPTPEEEKLNTYIGQSLLELWPRDVENLIRKVSFKVMNKVLHLVSEGKTKQKGGSDGMETGLEDCGILRGKGRKASRGKTQKQTLFQSLWRKAKAKA